jgi:hypothetical protein
MTFKKWSSLNSFHEVIKNLNYPRIHEVLKQNNYEIEYGLKIKLHGTNACIRVESNGKVTAQKRSSDITPFKDNMGFADFVANHASYFSSLANEDTTLYIYGEWCGPGIQQGVACSLTNQKYFYVYCVDAHQYGEFSERIYCPEIIEMILGTNCIDRVLVLPWYDKIKISFIDKPSTEKALHELNTMVEAIGERDPFMFDLFGIDGCGEGVVAYPLLGSNAPLMYQSDDEFFSWFNFKAKSEAHRVNKTKTAVAFDPEKYASVQMFADNYCTEQRFEQAFSEAVNREKDMRRTPDFIKWVVSDIYKESETERAASPELDWKAISKACSSRAVMWYKAKVMEL